MNAYEMNLRLLHTIEGVFPCLLHCLFITSTDSNSVAAMIKGLDSGLRLLGLRSWFTTNSFPDDFHPFPYKT